MPNAPRMYTLRRALRFPRAYYLRHREKDLSPLARSIHEKSSYSRAIYAMKRTLQTKPDLLIDFGLGPESVVVDGGAYVGKWSERIARATGAQVYAFEPSPTPLRSLYERLAGYPNVRIFEYGLGIRDETATLSLQGPGSSLHDTGYVKSRNVETTTVRIRDVEAVLQELQLDHIDLLELNIEGSEYDVIPRLAECGRLSSIDVLLVQFHEWFPRAHRRRRAVQRLLRRTHTQLWDYPWVWEAWRRTETL